MKPLVPDEADLRGVPWMKLDTARLLESDFFAKASDAEFRAAITLWCKAWTQTPAGSLPNDDQILAHMCSVNLAKWKKLKGRALHGWIECNDGRLYHPVIAEQVNVAWAKRKAYLAKQDANNERKQRERNLRQSLFARLREAGHVLKWDTPTAELKVLADSMAQQEGTVAAPVTGQSEPCPAPVTERSQAGHAAVTEQSRVSHAPVTPPVTEQSHTSHRLKREESVGVEKRSSSESKSKKIGGESLKGGVGENFARMDETARPGPDPMPAPPAQAPSVFDGWIFAESPPAKPEPASDVERDHAVPEPTVMPEPAPVPSVQAEPPFDELLLDDDMFALAPEDEAEVNQILFGKPPPQPPPTQPPSAEKKSRAAKTGDAATRAERATRIAADWTLSDKNRQWAKENRPDIDIDLEAKKFHNHFLGVGGKDARRVDWDATWRKWALNAWGKPHASTSHHYSQHPSNRNRLEPIAI